MHGQSFYIKKKGTTSEILNYDHDREMLYQDIVELLIAAGYFRARIQNLEPFDKILGGIAWTLTGCFIDFDIEFKDEMNLAEKIKVSEKISTALKAINCPYMLSPIQLQGLDLPIIFQVLQWLVKKLLETRDERNEVNRKNATNYFKTNLLFKSKNKFDNSTFKSSADVTSRNTNENTNSSLKKYQEEISKAVDKSNYNYINKGRLFRPVSKQNFEYNDPLKIYFTLIEYGMNKDLSFQRTLLDLLKKKNLIEISEKEKESFRRKTISATAKKEEITSTNLQNQTESAASITISNDEKKILQEIISTNIKEISEGNLNYHRINTNVMEEIFSENVEAIISEIQKYENIKEDENFDKIKIYVKEKERLENNITNLVVQINEYENEFETIKQLSEDNNFSITLSNEEIQKLTKTLEENNKNFEKLNLKVKQAKVSEEKMKTIGDKIKQREDLKQSIAKFKKDCLEEKTNYDNQIEILEKKIAKMSDADNTQVFEEIDKSYQSEYQKMLIKKKDLFDQNKIINLLTRKIQVFPSKLELIQYQKRFQELYDQINHISEKSKNIMNDLNSKEEVLKLLNQKLEIFVQLREGYKQCKSKKDKETFKESLQGVMDSLTESVSKSKARLKQMNKQIEENQTKLNELQLYENKYMKLIKEYTREYNKYNRSYN